MLLSRQFERNTRQNPPDLRIGHWLHQPWLMTQADQRLDGACPRPLDLLTDCLVLRLPESIDPHGLEEQIKVLDILVEPTSPRLRLA